MAMPEHHPEAEEGAELLFPGPEFGVREHVAEVCWDLGEACGEERLVRARRWRPHGPGSLPRLRATCATLDGWRRFQHQRGDAVRQSVSNPLLADGLTPLPKRLPVARDADVPEILQIPKELVREQVQAILLPINASSWTVERRINAACV
eukprot:CAMPEP_0177715620 /NCGR_PEP_ID=MMETSP0484_2-20121128/14091_1 /TAXON_ID=354590 /ORGANISM="Rhodomonas lens, Strain RHODO" /LENGTH=149 /DNA_ID=CAMNT_0019227631 /DNA_START=476 /DNA_END=925 /DNA_ORIENTATION=-